MTCEEFQMAAMAIADGETPPMEAQAVERHLASCALCRQQAIELQTLSLALGRQTRRTHAADVWPAVERELSWRPGLALAVLVAALAIYKLVEFVPDRTLGIWVQLIPAALAFALFRSLGWNPFRIDARLRLGKEEQ